MSVVVAPIIAMKAKNSAIDVLDRLNGLAIVDWKSRQYSDEFYFGEAITVHKSQGSQWDDLYVFDESGAFREDAQKHLYTAVTRAAERITVAR
jgi:DNA helicase IV